MKRTIAVVTTSRADFGHLAWPMRELRSRPDVDLKLIVMGAHLSPEFGTTVKEIVAAGLEIHGRIECLLSSDSDVGMAKTIGLATLGLADMLGALRPDLVLLIADRYEMLAPASVALALRIPIAHIEGGEISEGAIDDAVRNALTKMSHIHFTSTEQAKARVIAMGEEPWRVHRAGAPSLDHLTRDTLLTREELEARLGIDLNGSPDPHDPHNTGQKTLLVAYHPVTLLPDTTAEADALFAALAASQGQILFCYPNSDAGSRQLIDRAKAFLDQRGEHRSGGRSQGRIFSNLDSLTYWSLLAQVDILLGNSSSGIMESASFALPTVNVGLRQKGRERARNVIDVEPSAGAIRAALARAGSSAFRAELQGMVNPYGDGHASERIAEVLTTVELGQSLLQKRATEVGTP